MRILPTGRVESVHVRARELLARPFTTRTHQFRFRRDKDVVLVDVDGTQHLLHDALVKHGTAQQQGRNISCRCHRHDHFEKSVNATMLEFVTNDQVQRVTTVSTRDREQESFVRNRKRKNLKRERARKNEDQSQKEKKKKMVGAFEIKKAYVCVFFCSNAKFVFCENSYRDYKD